jgi:acyl-coenzyme A thioesterase PaaI-like protein
VHAQLLSRARPGRLVARGVLLKRGARLAFARGEVEQEGRRVAAVDVTFALI